MSWCCAACFEHWDKFLDIQNSIFEQSGNNIKHMK